MGSSADIDAKEMTDAAVDAVADVAGHAAAAASRAKDAVASATRTATEYAKEVPGKLSDTAHAVADETSKRLPDEMPRRSGLMVAVAVGLVALVIAILRRRS